MKTIALRFAGPLQSWAGEATVKTRVDTNRHPSHRAIKGMLAAAFGVSRGEEYPSIIRNAVIEVVPLKDGKIIKDFQIVSLRPGEEDYLQRIGQILKRGKLFNNKDRLTPDNEKKNSTIVRRTYLGDASFLVLITGASEEETSKIYERLQNPVWSMYLGKKAFPPTFPFILGLVNSENSVDEALLRLRKIEEVRGE